MTDDLDFAYQLIDCGIPVVVVRDGKKFPSGWTKTRPDRATLKGFRPGVDALLMVCGNGIDVIDVDPKTPGQSRENLPPGLTFWGRVVTPSGGEHLYVPSSGLGNRDIKGVGDYRGVGGGAYLPGSTRAEKYPGLEYRLDFIDWGVLTAQPDDLLVELLGEPQERERYFDDSPVRVEPGLHRYAESAIAWELADLRRLEDEHLSNWDIGTYNTACNLIEFANSNWSGYTLERAEQDLMDNAPTDPGFGQREHRAKWESALGNIGGGGRRLPEDRPVGGDFPPGEHPIWDASPQLAQVRQAAHSRMVSSDALLCHVLGRVLAEVPPHVMLPPTIGGPASLNLAFAVVGASGTGKSAVAKVSGELMNLGQDGIEIGLGSGEGLIESFLEADPDDPRGRRKRLVSPPKRILAIDEIGRLDAVAKRDGSSMLSVMREALTGQALKTSNATEERRRNVEADSYRLVVFAGVQPRLSGTLLGDVDAGTPQRYCWVRSTDGSLPEDLPEWPGELDCPAFQIELMGPQLIEYPQHIKAEIRRLHKAKMRGEQVDPRQGHRALVQLKLAAAVTLFHGVPAPGEPLRITDRWWAVAGAIMAESDRVQQFCLDELGQATQDKSKARGRAAAVEDEMVDHDRAVRDAAERIIEMVTPDGVTWSSIRDRLSNSQRSRAEKALARLVRDGRLIIKEEKQGNGQPMRTMHLTVDQ